MPCYVLVMLVVFFCLFETVSDVIITSEWYVPRDFRNARDSRASGRNGDFISQKGTLFARKSII